MIYVICSVQDYYTPLHTAVRHGKHLVVQVVLGFGADVNCRGGQVPKVFLFFS